MSDRSSKAVEHIIPAPDKRAERHVRDILRRPQIVDQDDWDDYDFTPREQKFKKQIRLE